MKSAFIPVSIVAISLMACSSDDSASSDDGGATSSPSEGSSNRGTPSGAASSREGPLVSPTHADGAKNLDETDVDCGGDLSDPAGQKAKRCDVGQGCVVAADCASAACRYDGKCVDVSEKSCVLHHGGDTCGPADAQESCCKTIPLNDSVRLDKYVVTAGRYRAFVEAVNGDIRGWLQTNKPASWRAAWDNFVPAQLNDGRYVSHQGVYQELGPGLFYEAEAGNMGCSLDTYGARTWWVPDDISMALWKQKNHYTKDQLDEKALNCVTFYMLAAFCAWDGGRLPTDAEINRAWGERTYPWGNTPAPQGWSTSFNNAQEASTNATKRPATGDMLRANFHYNYWSPSDRACPGGVFCDYSVHIAQPGRFPNGNGPLGHADLAGLVFNITRSSVNDSSTLWSKSGSWQGHQIPWPLESRTFPRVAKYWATGGRCAR